MTSKFVTATAGVFWGSNNLAKKHRSVKGLDVDTEQIQEFFGPNTDGFGMLAPAVGTRVSTLCKARKTCDPQCASLAPK